MLVYIIGTCVLYFYAHHHINLETGSPTMG